MRLKNEQINSSTSFRVISGKVVDLAGRPIAAATIWTPQGTGVTVADADGHFRLTVPDNEPVIQLQVSGDGFFTKSLELKEDAALPPALIKLEPKFSNVILGYITSVPVKKTGKKQPVYAAAPAKKEIARSAKSYIDTFRSFFKIYPNPLTAATSVNIELVQEIGEGYFDMNILTMDGKPVHGKNKLWIDKGAKVLNIQIPSIAAGNYLFVLKRRKDGRAFSQQIVIQ